MVRPLKVDHRSGDSGQFGDNTDYLMLNNFGKARENRCPAELLRNPGAVDRRAIADAEVSYRQN